MNSQVLLDIGLIVTSTVFFGLWSAARHRAKDFETDLRTLIVKHDLDSRDLRRSLRHKRFRKFVISRSERQMKESLEKSDLSQNTGGDENW